MNSLPFGFFVRPKRWLILAGVLFSASLTRAGTESTPTVQPPPSDTSSPWEVRIGVPVWLPTITGYFGVRGVTSSVDWDTLNDSSWDGLFAMSAYVRYHRWEIFGDGFYGNVSDAVTVPRLLSAPADLDLTTKFAQLFLGYRVIDSPKGYLSLFAGARYNCMEGDLQISDNGDPRFPALRQALGIPNNLRVSGSKSWVDPVVGVTGKVHVWKPISLWAKGDVGGFDVSSGTAYSINGGVEFQVTRYCWLQTGWAYTKFDFNSGGFVNNTELSGPLIQLGGNF